MTPQAKLIDLYTGHAIDLTRLGSTSWRELVPFFTKLQKDLLEQIGKIDPTSSPIAAKRRRDLNRLFEVNNETIKTHYAEIKQTHQAFVLDLADYEQAFESKAFNTALGVDIGATVLTPSQLESLVSAVAIQGAPSKAWWARQETKLMHAFADQMRMGFAQGESVAKLKARTRQLMGVSSREAEALARTSVQAIAGDVSEKMIERNSDLTKGSIHSSTLDGKTSFICMARDGMKWDNNKKPVGHSLPYKNIPLHWQCRSRLIPWLKSFEDLGSKIKIELPEGTRASMDGQVPAKTNYQSWLKTKPVEFQKEVLGVWRYEKFSKGKLELRDLVNQNDRTLTIEQLRSKL